MVRSVSTSASAPTNDHPLESSNTMEEEPQPVHEAEERTATASTTTAHVEPGTAHRVSSGSAVEPEDDEEEVEATEDQAKGTASSPAVVERAHVEDDDDDEEEDEYEYEDDDDAAFSGFLVDHPELAVARSVKQDNEDSTKKAPARIEQDEQAETAKPKYRPPSKDAVQMSLRAQHETTGGKRRLAQDLFRIMNQDTQAAGFSLEPSKEDQMDQWTIKLFQLDQDSNLAKDMLVLGLDCITLQMTFSEQYPFEPPFVQVLRPRFQRQTGFVMNGALCMELLTKEGWNPINDIESVIVSIRSLLVVGDGRLEAAYNLSKSKYQALLQAAESKPQAKDSDSKSNPDDSDADPALKRQRKNSAGDDTTKPNLPCGTYSASEAQAAYSHLTSYHKKKGWDTSGWWAKKG